MHACIVFVVRYSLLAANDQPAVYRQLSCQLATSNQADGNASMFINNGTREEQRWQLVNNAIAGYNGVAVAARMQCRIS